MSPDFDVRQSIDGNVATLSVRGRFDFSQYSAFKEEQTRILEKEGITEIVLDFSGLDYLDSAALGILLVMLDRAKERGQTVIIRRATGVVREILDVAHFERMFVIED
jgi:anti-anti-sigma factor